jgi:hypothetical protein
LFLQSAYGKKEEFFLFGCIMDCTMIDKRLSDKPLQVIKVVADLTYPNLS